MWYSTLNVPLVCRKIICKQQNNRSSEDYFDINLSSVPEEASTDSEPETNPEQWPEELVGNTKSTSDEDVPMVLWKFQYVTCLCMNIISVFINA